MQKEKLYLIFYEVQVMSVVLIVDKISYVLEFDITLDVKCKLICNTFSDVKDCA
jgi:hypothetical protein